MLREQTSVEVVLYATYLYIPRPKLKTNTLTQTLISIKKPQVVRKLPNKT